MSKKSLVAIIVFLVFAIVIILFNEEDQKDEEFVELEQELKEIEEELKQREDANDHLKEDIKSKEERFGDLRWEHISTVEINDKLTEALLEMSISSAILTDAEISGGLLNLDMFYVTREGDQYVQEEEEFINQITKNVPIYMLNEENEYREKDWDYMVNLDRIPLLQIFENNFDQALFIREIDRDHDYDLENIEKDF